MKYFIASGRFQVESEAECGIAVVVDGQVLIALDMESVDQREAPQFQRYVAVNDLVGINKASANLEVRRLELVVDNVLGTSGADRDATEYDAHADITRQPRLGRTEDLVGVQLYFRRNAFPVSH